MPTNTGGSHFNNDLRYVIFPCGLERRFLNDFNSVVNVMLTQTGTSTSQYEDYLLCRQSEFSSEISPDNYRDVVREVNAELCRNRNVSNIERILKERRIARYFAIDNSFTNSFYNIIVPIHDRETHGYINATQNNNNRCRFRRDYYTRYGCDYTCFSSNYYNYGLQYYQAADDLLSGEVVRHMLADLTVFLTNIRQGMVDTMNHKISLPPFFLALNQDELSLNLYEINKAIKELPCYGSYSHLLSNIDDQHSNLPRIREKVKKYDTSLKVVYYQANDTGQFYYDSGLFGVSKRPDDINNYRFRLKFNNIGFEALKIQGQNSASIEDMRVDGSFDENFKLHFSQDDYVGREEIVINPTEFIVFVTENLNNMDFNSLMNNFIGFQTRILYDLDGNFTNIKFLAIKFDQRPGTIGHQSDRISYRRYLSDLITDPLIRERIYTLSNRPINSL